MITFKTLFYLCAAGITVKADEPQAKMLDDFESTREIGSWFSVNDGVMGGLSKGAPMISDQKTLVFKGDISLDNNGGFSSIRTRGTTHDLSGYEGIELKIKTDGRKYFLTSRSDGRRMLAYWSPIQSPKDEWVVVRVPFDSFYASYFGRKVPNLKLNSKNIKSVGFMLYDKKAGAFAIEVEHIKAYKDTGGGKR